jgi:excisionase family DNA binding protein
MDNETKTPMTMEQASTFTGYSIKYLYKLVHDGTIPYYKPDNTDKGKAIFCKEELTEWIFRNRRATKEEIRKRADKKLLEAEK